MKKILCMGLLSVLYACDKDEISDKVNRFNSGNKSEELKGYWKFEGAYKLKEGDNGFNMVFGNRGVEAIGPGEMVYFDADYLRFLNHDAENTYSTWDRTKHYWYNDGKIIYSLNIQKPYDGMENIVEFQWPYAFGKTNDTLIVQNSGRLLYLTRHEEVPFKIWSP